MRLLNKQCVNVFNSNAWSSFSFCFMLLYVYIANYYSFSFCFILLYVCCMMIGSHYLRVLLMPCLFYFLLLFYSLSLVHSLFLIFSKILKFISRNLLENKSYVKSNSKNFCFLTFFNQTNGLVGREEIDKKLCFSQPIRKQKIWQIKF